eukprot:scaffold23741_cov22-Cyclotella_meneghiniana.AAC.3
MLIDRLLWVRIGSGFVCGHAPDALNGIDCLIYGVNYKQRHGGSSDDVLNGGPRLETSTWHQHPPGERTAGKKGHATFWPSAERELSGRRSRPDSV